MVIVPRSVLIAEVENFIQTRIEEVALTISTEKTEKFVFAFEKGILVSRNADTGRKKNLSYLGMSFDGRRVFLKHASLANYQRKVVAAVRRTYKFAYRNKLKKLPRTELYERYTRYGKRNYQTYIKRCVKTLKDHGFDAAYLKRQASDYFVHKVIKRMREVVWRQVLRRQERRKKRG